MFIKLYISDAEIGNILWIIHDCTTTLEQISSIIISNQAKFTIGIQCYNIVDILCNGASSLEWPHLKS